MDAGPSSLPFTGVIIMNDFESAEEIMEREVNNSIYSLTKGDVELLTELKVNNQYIKQEIAHMLDCLERINSKLDLHDQKLWANGEQLERLQVKFNELDEKFKRSTVGHFLRNNWWKVTTFILGISTILGGLGEYLYRLPPPK